ncbi:MAG: chitobiase/beta-hexosaminidase C-terminal domain-containing protein [Clostridiales bacterium]|nr:chitobiase/beta-hexosaminidase C-terminal domain-containing protein [Clostridiales bacterium]
MVCSKCGAELKEGCVYCSQCGQEAQIVSEINILEDDLLRDLMDDSLPAGDGKEPHSAEKEKTSSGGGKESGKTGTSEAKEKEQLRRREEKRRERQRRKRRRTAVVLLILLAVILAGGVSLVRYQRNHSTEYLFTRAEEAYDQKNYKNALGYLEKLFALDEDNADGLLLNAQICLAQKDYEEAETLFLHVIALDDENTEAYEGLIRVYDAQGRTDLILALMDGVTDEDILVLFEDYVIPTPQIEVESGSYSEYFTVKISAEKKTLSIYYTLDGSTPTPEDTLYEEPVEISEQGTITLTAICADEDGNCSEPVSATYKVALKAPDMPTVSPDGGQYTTPVSITVSVPSGTTVYYTWDNTTPTTASSKYTGPLEMPEGNNILSLISVDENGMQSEVLKCNYIYYPETTAADENETAEGGESAE